MLSKSLLSMLLRIKPMAHCVFPPSPIAAFDILSKDIISLSTFSGHKLLGDRRFRAQIYHIRVVKKECVLVALSSQRSCIRYSRCHANVYFLSAIRIVFNVLRFSSHFGKNCLWCKMYLSSELFQWKVWQTSDFRRNSSLFQVQTPGLLEASPSHGPWENSWPIPNP